MFNINLYTSFLEKLKIIIIFPIKMKQFIYYNINDPIKEPLGKIQAGSLNEATEFASQIKKLNKDAFLSTFKVEEYEEKKKNEKPIRLNRKGYQYPGESEVCKK